VSLTSLLESPPSEQKPAPRVDSHPPFAITLGPEAAELAEKAGLCLDPWQRDSLDVMCALGDDGTWLCFECGEIVSRQNGKGAILEARVLAGFLLFGEELIIWTAHQYKTAIELFLRVQRLIKTLEAVGEIAPGLVKTIYTNGEQGFERTDTGQRIKFIARSKDSGRGFSGDVVIVDEAYAYTLAMQEALMPTMSARPNPQIIYASSPPLTGDAGEVLYALRDRAEAGGDDSLCWRDWGLAGDLDDIGKVGPDGRALIDLDDEANWVKANPGYGIRLTRKFTRKERRSMSKEGFARERLGVWPKRLEGGNGMLTLELWAALADTKSKRHGEVAIAVAVNPNRDRAAIAIAGRRRDGLLHWEVIDHREGPPDWIPKRLLQLKTKHKPVVIVIDGKGPTASLITELAKLGIKPSADKDKPQSGDLLIVDTQGMADAFAMLVDTARLRQGRHIDQAPLTSALAGAATRQLGDGGQAWGRKGSTDITPLEGVTLANYGFEVRAHLVVANRIPHVW
jgi:hypothetical protein